MSHNDGNARLQHLLLELTSLGFLELSDSGGRLWSEHAAARMLSQFVVSLVKVGLADLDQLGQRSLVVGVDVGQSEGGNGLAAHNLAETGLALDDAIWHAHLLAQGRQVQDDLKLNRNKNDELVNNANRKHNSKKHFV